jgi:HEAT repeat protein
MLDLGQLRHHIKTLNAGDKSFWPEAIHSLKGHEAREWATAPLEVVGPLVESLRCQLTGSPAGNGLNCSPTYRQDVATLLGKIGPRSASAIPQLIELLKDGKGEGVREAAATALGRIGKQAGVAVRDLIGVLRPNCRVHLAARVARALGDIGWAGDEVRSALVGAWLLPGDYLKSQASIALCQLGCAAPGLLPNLTATLVSSRDAAQRKLAAEALGWCSRSDAGVVPALAAALNDGDEEIRGLATFGLRRMKLTQEKAIQVCCQQLKDSPHAEAALRRFGQSAVPALIRALGAEDATTREKAAQTLSGIGEAAAKAVPPLSLALRDGDAGVRLAVAKALWSITKEVQKVVPALAHLLERKWSPGPEADESRRRFFLAVIESLGRIGPPAQEAIPALLEKTGDENRHIRESAIRALRQIGPDAAAKAGSR